MRFQPATLQPRQCTYLAAMSRSHAELGEHVESDTESRVYGKLCYLI